MLQVQKTDDSTLIRKLTPHYQEMADFARNAYPGSNVVTHLLEPSIGCANDGCAAIVECCAQDNPWYNQKTTARWGSRVYTPSGDIVDKYKREFGSDSPDSFFMSGYCDPAPKCDAVRDITKAILRIIATEPDYIPKKGMRFQTQSPMVVDDSELQELIIELSNLGIPFYVGVSAPTESCTKMLATAENLLSQGIEVQLCVAPAKPESPEAYARKIRELNPNSVLYQVQHPTDGKSAMHGPRKEVLSLDKFRELLRSEGYKGPVEDKNHTFTLLTPQKHLN